MKKIFIRILFFVFAILIVCGCGKSQEDYKTAIELKGITYSIDSFIEQIKKGNKEVVELFVKCVFRIIPTTDSGVNRPLILEAIDH